MKIKKRDGKYEKLIFSKIQTRLRKMINGDDFLQPLKNVIDIDNITQQIISRLYDGISSNEIDEETCRICVGIIECQDMPILASRIAISNMHRNTFSNYETLIDDLHSRNIINQKFYNTVKTNINLITKEIDYTRDYNFDYFGFKTLEKSFLLKINNDIVERPQQMYMRVAFTIFNENPEKAIELYHLISMHYYTHASPTIFNSGINLENLSSCYLAGVEDSVEGIYKLLSDCAKISKVGGGIGIHVSNIRAKGSKIRKTNGESDGIVPMLKVFDNTCTYINQSGRRKGSFAIFIEPWHADIMEFLDLKKPQGHDSVRARNLFYGIWVPDLFMEKVKSNEEWYLMCPDECPGLNEVYGNDFVELYEKYISENKYKKIVNAQDVWKKILDSQIETGVPYIGYKDNVNERCNQKNLGTIKSSNLCMEISLYSDSNEYSICNLASIALPKYVDDNLEFNFEKLQQVSSFIVDAMNNVIDNSYCPVDEGIKSNSKHRPLGIGVQGLADTFIKMKIPFESEQAKDLNKKIFETIYYSVLKSSMELAKTYGKYSSFENSPFSKGILQFDMCDVDFKSSRYDWELLKQDIIKYGTRNSMLTALMPTATTAQILGNSECFEPIDSCLYKKRVISGEYVIINKNLIKDLTELNLWNKQMKDLLIYHNGSIQEIEGIPDNLKQIYKTCWEISMKTVIEQCRDRGLFIDQMQSMNFFIKKPTWNILNSVHFYAWKNKLKTGMYYLRSLPSSNAGKFGISANMEQNNKNQIKNNIVDDKQQEVIACPIDCFSCSS